MDIRVRAGKKAYQIIKDGGFDWDSITTYFAPAGGPRWLTATGFDLSLLNGGYLGNGGPVLLVGSSAGAWRLAAWLQPQAEESYRRLMEAYILKSYDKYDTPPKVLASLEEIVNAYIDDDALPFALRHKKYRLAVITARGKGLLNTETNFVQTAGFGVLFALNFFSRSYVYWMVERVVFHNAPRPPYFCLFQPGFQGSYIPLTEINFKSAIVSSGAVPLYVSGVKDIYGGPRGRYYDGGLVDYHLTQRFNERDGELTLFFHHQERIIPTWFDKKLKSRGPSDEALSNVLMVHMTDDFVSRLPNSRVCDRTDFKTYVNDPETRMANWRQTVAMAAPLGDQFIELVESGRLAGAVEPLG